MTAAVGHGKKTARNIDAFLRGEVYIAPDKHSIIHFGALNLPVFLDAARREAPEVPIAKRSGFEEIAEGLTEAEARYEAGRCLSCGNCFECDNCYAACPDQAILKLGPGRGYRVDYALCSGCAVCFEQCPCHAIEMIPEPAAGIAAGLIVSRHRRRDSGSARDRGVDARSARDMTAEIARVQPLHRAHRFHGKRARH
jgi:Pyruvate/2-oxoacid:ferredoxin oxidoreductase delta subunit